MANSAHVSNEDALDFQEAMRDFHVMFPSLNAEVIEAVLRAHGGAVDETIDQLLMMTMEDDSETMPKKVISNVGTHVDLPGCSELPRTERDYGYLHTGSRMPPIDYIPDRPPPPYSEIVGPNPSRITYASPPHVQPIPYSHSQRQYDPPLVGRLPDDFLRISPVDTPLNGSRRAYREKELVTCNKYSGHKPKRMPGAGLGIFYPFDWSTPRHSTRSSDDYGRSWQGQHRQMDHQKMEKLRQQSTYLKEKIVENEWNRQLTRDPDLERFLEDERLALMMQDKEFMRELKNDKEFMRGLERDVSLASLSSQAHSTAPLSTTSTLTSVETPSTIGTARRKSSSSKKHFGRDKSNAEPQPVLYDDPSAVSAREAAIFAQYRTKSDGPASSRLPSDDFTNLNAIPDAFESSDGAWPGVNAHDTAVDAFPYTKVVDRVDNGDHQDFSEKLKYMGATSRKKLAMTARKFWRKRKGSSAILGSRDYHSSGMTLLDATDDPAAQERRRNFGRESGYDQMSSGSENEDSAQRYIGSARGREFNSRALSGAAL